MSDQRGWYSRSASKYKLRAQILGIIVVSAGAAATVLQALHGATWVPIATALFGAAVTITEGWRQIARYDESWTAYRVASERMKRERRLYTNGAGAYRNMPDEEQAFVQFVEAIETIIAEEQRIFWRDRGTQPAAPNASKPPQPGHEPLAG